LINRMAEDTQKVNQKRLIIKKLATATQQEMAD
jgi:hypothetical protein